MYNQSFAKSPFSQGKAPWKEPQSKYFAFSSKFFCKDIAYFKISYYFCTAFEKKQHSSLAQSVRASDC